jgi:CRP/FNR family transcriptional regulator
MTEYASLHTESGAIRYFPQSGATTRSGKTRADDSPCAACPSRRVCAIAELATLQRDLPQRISIVRRRVQRDRTLYSIGDAFQCLYVIRSGQFKTSLVHEDGRVQVIGFHMRGEVMGVDGIGDQRYTCNAVALEDSEVCVVPFHHLSRLAAGMPAIQMRVHKLMSRELVDALDRIVLLGNARAEERLAALLLNLSQRFAARGYSPREFNLSMSREEIGNYLGLAPETVSRILSRFQRDGLIEVNCRRVRLLDTVALRNCGPSQLVSASAH